MKVLVVGSGGREHAICRAVAKSSRVDKIYCAPGNAGIAALAECVPIGAMEFDKLVSFAKDNAIDFTMRNASLSNTNCTDFNTLVLESVPSSLTVKAMNGFPSQRCF